MTYSRVLGTIGLIGATVLGAMGPAQLPSAADASPSFSALSPAAAKAAAAKALRAGFFTTRQGHRIYLSSALVNGFQGAGGNSASSNTAHANTVHSNATPPQVGQGSRANQDYGFYQTGNGQLFHNTESVAVDPLGALHVVVSATDTRLGSDGSFFNISSNPTINGQCFTGASPVPCVLIQALGGPGIYNSVDGARSFSDQIIPDTLTGAVPNAINTAVSAAAVGCIPPTGAFTPPALGAPQDCLPYDSVGDQSVAFDSVGNLYTASLGLVSANPLVSSFTGIAQTDVLVNVSPAVQPLFGSAFVIPPNAAGRFFNALPSSAGCNPTVVGPGGAAGNALCLHGEVTASTYATNFLPLATAAAAGRNWPADNGTHFPLGAPGGITGCGITAFCLIDQPYLTIDNGVDSLGYLTYTLYDFTNGTSNIYLQTAVTPPGGATGSLPAWTAPLSIDNPNATTYGVGGNNGNFYCSVPNTIVAPFPFCGESWGADTAVGPDGQVYIAYENFDYTNPADLRLGAILVATLGPGGGTVLSTSFVAEVLDHDAFNLFSTTGGAGPNVANPAALDPANQAYFTIPNRPTIAVTGPISIGTVPYQSGVVIVAWTDQRSLSGGALNTSSGTRIWYALGTPKPRISTLQPNAVHFDVLGNTRGAGAFNLTSPLSAAIPTAAVDTPGGFYDIAEVSEQNLVVNQFFPWVTASQVRFNSTINDNIFIGFYSEYPSNTAAFKMSFGVGKSSDGGNTFGVNPAGTNMPLPAVPLSRFLCTSFGFAASADGDALCNSTPYFGTYTGIANDFSNGAYAAWTDTRSDSRDFNVPGSQNVYAVHVN